MTTATLASELARRGPMRATPGPKPRADAPQLTFDSALAQALLVARIGEAERLQFPNPIYQRDPVGFARNILGIQPWSRQCEGLEAVRDHDRVAMVSGHKIGKSTMAAILALWWFAGWEDARCIMSSTTSRQVDQILWREIRMLRARSGRCLDCKAADPYGHMIPVPCPHSAVLDGDQGELARTGLKSRTDFREIVGFTAREAEAVAGISGRHLLYIIDEASGVPDMIFEAIEGNRAGGAKIVMFGNGTRNEGEFFEAFHGKSSLYKTLRISSEETPNVVEGRDTYPGLATPDWIDEKKREWGETSPMYTVRVKGGFATSEEGKIFSLHAIAQSQVRWHDTPVAGRLFVGVDPAGESGTGDDAAFVARRGLKMLEYKRRLGLTVEGHVIEVLETIARQAVPRETVVVVVDREGPIGSKVWLALRTYADKNPGVFELTAVLASNRAVRRNDLYDRVRDELVANLEAWMRDGGAVMEDAKLEGELHVMRWEQAPNGRYKCISKRIIKKLIGRSPDTFDALALATWESLSLSDADDASTSAGVTPDAPQHVSEVFDPYTAMDVWRR